MSTMKRSAVESSEIGLFEKMKGGVMAAPKASLRDSFFSGLGGLIAIGIVSYLSVRSGVAWLMAPFGASCVLVFGAHKSPLAQPRSVIGGHLIATFTGLVVLNLFGQTWWAPALGVGLAISLMLLTKTLHAPAGADPMAVILAKAGWSFLVEPVLLGSVVIVLVGLLFNNLLKERQYPQYWL